MSNSTRLGPASRIWIFAIGAAVLQGGIAVAMELVSWPSHVIGVLLQVAVLWTAILVLAAIATRRITSLTHTLTQHEHAHLATLDHVGQLEIQNALLTSLAKSVDVGLAFQSLARLVARLVECDRLGLALLKENGQGFQTYTARVTEEERRHRPRPDLEFGMDRTLMGSVVRSREALITNDLGTPASDFLDANVLHSAGFQSALIMPLMAKGRAVGTINLVSRRPGAFVSAHVESLTPITEILAVAILAQQWQVSLAKYRTMEAAADVTLGVANEINSALQAIIGSCNVLEREHPDNPALQRDLASVVRQAQRIAELLENMRHTTQERLVEAAARVSETRIPSSPEEIEDETPR
jgi:GAF domain-containing protein